MARSERAVVARDLFVGASNVVTATLIAYSLDGPTAWPLGAVAVAFGSVLFAAVDRSAAGTWGLTVGLSGSIVAFAAVLWWLGPGTPLAVLPPLLFGLGIGTAANRLLFGVVYPLPEACLRRENLT
ncbi:MULTISPECIES: hypothetical protein [Haloarcula]|uniref:Uncharacterized protein n=1 Tax=Haloarcula pellucida TaxID=1427151 RepID=A0A830GPZ7_9EURY|nr:MULTISPECIES: hypothetical protein [Halomicroarcula]MBX0350110.1 hypothetical protein [Halomicroarcula pellucida]MDS0277789.1 hypothetical protein [Halomicroarcula sp. S1AR25-4]GGO00458.1 hypothetical protein GCM10009030_33110 [Halomicroarcula pellucida]